MESFENFDSIATFFLLVCNLEVLTFKETFVTDEAHESLGTMVDNVVFYFTDACKRQMAKLQTSTDLRSAMASIQEKLITPIKVSGIRGVLQPLLLRAQQTYNNMEASLIKCVQREIATHIRGYDKKAFVKAMCDETQFEPDWEHDLLSHLGDKNLRGANLYPPVCFAVGIVLKNVDFIGGYRLNKLASEALDAMRASIVDAEYAFGKMCTLDKALVRINQDFFMMRHLPHVFVHMDEFYGIDSLSSIYGLYNTAERQFCAGVAGLLLGDFQSFTRKQIKHDHPAYEEKLAAATAQLTNKLPILKRRMEHQLPQKHFKRAFRRLKQSLQDIIMEYPKKFSFQPPTIPEEKDDGEAAEPCHHLIRL
ncbi:3-methyl-2-oxobutanoate hydroxymethyltransferase, putative [Babesia ovata]|uniref:3-methyl-2-oxobutanoate hydroxymethyltransferase, putative n=1 Tax=Babesia ovata TaxID=189622 RepID=A0A2H6KH68_9APIC|nr:3-methyl-2-oxobutanoate hydroxymethyltransferase, putative [Babesia ovata]GBE62337.1 3-methyl-2-oxobutanoate hydroxymethyltransferase, putative [Babesia ovata]